LGKQTPLYAFHVAAGAKIVDCAGWDMPLHYRSLLEEHHRVRRDAGMFDVSFMLPIDITGAGAQAFLTRLLANDIGKLTVPGRAHYSCMLKENGGIIDDLKAYFFAPDDYRIVVNAINADKDIAWMRNQAARTGANVTISARRNLAMIAVQGPNARKKVWAALPETFAVSEALRPFEAVRWNTQFGELMISCSSYTGEDGFELIFPAQRAIEIWQDLTQAGVNPIGLGALETLRLEAGLKRYGADIDETRTPFEAGLAWTVDLTGAREFVGRSAIDPYFSSTQLVGLVLENRGILRSQMRVITSHGDGETTSGSFSPTLKTSIAFARVPTAIAIGDRVEVEIRGKLRKARVAKLGLHNGKIPV